jgi:hypothetical protein
MSKQHMPMLCPSWKLDDGGDKISRTFNAKNFKGALAWLNEAGERPRLVHSLCDAEPCSHPLERGGRMWMMWMMNQWMTWMMNHDINIASTTITTRVG